eukprot:CAMPEP_0182865192 /NCGR_PEP_ID=MMETSP0034_2-20130328/7564_1 /TAXON_ID=156128 /ORGANISM="Nephroselmis pyriformis, Strain CCMP717" /LENGTH=151 /DNA_ID=CAMNT_0024997481 /DNA_START=296 /DNA_END=749 /DNA_ORIENTATION=-
MAEIPGNPSESSLCESASACEGAVGDAQAEGPAGRESQRDVLGDVGLEAPQAEVPLRHPSPESADVVSDLDGDDVIAGLHEKVEALVPRGGPEGSFVGCGEIRFGALDLVPNSQGAVGVRVPNEGPDREPLRLDQHHLHLTHELPARALAP